MNAWARLMVAVTTLTVFFLLTLWWQPSDKARALLAPVLLLGFLVLVLWISSRGQ